MSARLSSSPSDSKGTARPPRLAASSAALPKVRPPTTVARAPLRTSWRAATWVIFPAPTRSTFLSRRSPKILRASSTATCETETALWPMPVSVRARLAAASERLRSAFRDEPRVPAFSAAS